MQQLIHIDCDAFFASVEQAADPKLRGRPVAVGGEKRGIIASASYEARAMGVYTPMPSARARQICPKLILIPGHYERYEQFSNWLFSYAYDFTPDVEICSIDEGYLDLTRTRKSSLEIAETLRSAIRQSLKISISEGIASNKITSQIASKLKKPNAFIHVPPGEEKAFLHPLSIRCLPGIGPQTAKRFEAAGLLRIGQVAATSEEMLSLLIGCRAPELRQYANGIDLRPVTRTRPAAKSYSQQETFEKDITDEDRVRTTLYRMADNLMRKIRAENRSIRQIEVKLRYNDFAEDRHSETLSEPTDLESDLYPRIRILLKLAWRRRVSLRLVALKCSKVYEGRRVPELGLFADQRNREARQRLAAALDGLRESHPKTLIFRGHSLKSAGQKPQNAERRSPDPNGKNQRSSRSVQSGTRKTVWPLLHLHSYYSFLDSTLSIRDLIETAQEQGVQNLALTDTGNLHGAVPFMQAAQAAGLRPILGTELKVNGKPLLLYVQNASGYQSLCEWISRESPSLETAWLRDTAGLIAVGADPALAPLFPNRFYLGAANGRAAQRWDGTGLPVIAVPRVHYRKPSDRGLYEIVQSIRTRTLLHQAHPDKRSAQALHIPRPGELQQTFAQMPEALENTRRLIERCSFAFDFGHLQFPDFHPPDGSTPHAFLHHLVFRGMETRYPHSRDSRNRVRAQLETELSIIAEVGYEDYFLIVWDLLQRCRDRGIEWITRGSAADSLVCYCLGISDVCPIRFDLYFQRFLNPERMKMKKLPDIDIDFPHDRKDDVVNLLFERYGPQHAAVVGGFSTFQGRSALAEIAKVLGVSEYQIRQVTRKLPRSTARKLEQVVQDTPGTEELPLLEEPYRTALESAQRLDSFPRYAKMHPCGVVLSRDPMTQLTPCFTSGKGWPTTHFDMDAVEAIGLVKIDILAQAGLSVMRDVRRAVSQKRETKLALPQHFDDPKVWDLISSGQARAVHHIESPAMISLARMCRPREIDTLVAMVSVIRPGAANQHKKQHFTRRSQGLEAVEMPHSSLWSCLGGTYGLIIYEEQILQICDVFAGMDPGQADRLRRALGKEKWDEVQELGLLFEKTARGKGHSTEDIQRVWDLVCGFSGYAFCKAHSAAYGVEAYQSAWLKRTYPAEFMAAVLSQGKGFYSPLVYTLECRRMGLHLLLPSVNHPGPDFMPQGRCIRVPIRIIHGFSESLCSRILSERQKGMFSSLQDFYRRTRPPPEDLDLLLRAGALDEFGSSRTALFWENRWLRELFREEFQNGASATPSLLPPPDSMRKPSVPLHEASPGERLQNEMEIFGFTISDHPLRLYPDIRWNRYTPISQLRHHIGKTLRCCGLIIEERITRQSGGDPMKFISLADWSGITEAELFAESYRRYGLATVRYPVLAVTATVEAFENGNGFTLRVHHAGKPETR